MPRVPKGYRECDECKRVLVESEFRLVYGKLSKTCYRCDGKPDSFRWMRQTNAPGSGKRR